MRAYLIILLHQRGFFSLGTNSTIHICKRYDGSWFYTVKKEMRPEWVANSARPIPEFRGVARGGQSPTEFGRSVNPIQTKGADYARHTTTSPPDSKCYLHLCWIPISVKVSAPQLSEYRAAWGSGNEKETRRKRNSKPSNHCFCTKEELRRKLLSFYHNDHKKRMSRVLLN